MHYGDSQIEMDRISSLLRQRLQKDLRNGSGIHPPIQTIPTFTTSQSYSGSLQRYVVVWRHLRASAAHRRYGLLGTFAQVYDNATITLTASVEKNTRERKNFSASASYREQSRKI